MRCCSRSSPAAVSARRSCRGRRAARAAGWREPPGAGGVGMTNAEVVALAASHEMPVYARQPVAFVRGRGAELWDADGKRYLDFFAGLAVNNVGHCHPAVVSAIREQAGMLLH